MTRFKLYTWLLLAGVFAPVLLVLGFNLLLAKQYSDSDRFVSASEWQEKPTEPPSRKSLAVIMAHSRPFG